MKTASTPAVVLSFKKTKWDIVAGIAIIHLGVLLAPFTFTWPAFWLFVGLQFITAMGITL